MRGSFWGEYKATDICNQKSLGKIMRNEVLENLKYTWYIEGNRSRENNYFKFLCEWRKLNRCHYFHSGCIFLSVYFSNDNLLTSGQNQCALTDLEIIIFKKRFRIFTPLMTWMLKIKHFSNFSSYFILLYFFSLFSHSPRPEINSDIMKG